MAELTNESNSNNDVANSSNDLLSNPGTTSKKNNGYSPDNPYDPSKYDFGIEIAGNRRRSMTKAANEWEEQQRVKRDERNYQEQMYLKYNSPEAMALQQRRAGINPDLAGGSGESSSFDAPNFQAAEPSVDMIGSEGFDSAVSAISSIGSIFSSAFGAINAIQSIRRQSIENESASLDLLQKEQETVTNPLFSFNNVSSLPMSRKQRNRIKSYDTAANQLLRYIQARTFANKANSLDFEGYNLEDSLSLLGEDAKFSPNGEFRHESPLRSKKDYTDQLKYLNEFEKWSAEQTKLERQFEYSKGKRREKFQEKLDKHQEYLNELRDKAIKSIFGDSDEIDHLNFWDFVLLQLYNLDDSKFDIEGSIKQVKAIFKFLNPSSGAKDSIKDIAGIFSKIPL